MALTCDQYDFLEIACMFHYDILLTAKNGEEMRGIADSLFIDADRVETLALKKMPSTESQAGDAETTKIATAEIMCLEVLTEGARFTQVKFV